MKVTPLPCSCGRPVIVYPLEGGRGTGDLTSYYVHCDCGIHERYLGADGTKRTATREWNQIVKKRAALGE